MPPEKPNYLQAKLAHMRDVSPNQNTYYVFLISRIVDAVKNGSSTNQEYQAHFVSAYCCKVNCPLGMHKNDRFH